ncbi:MAG: 3-deoxy-D-manno-octulosonic acid transferase [Candidatus Edwardsbacteria bacterium]|nr:3-deoxy-D-manno-octulosonic acid transferase [Candidatus Edwardsbacteria bacterium]MBU1577435.1 3-deoxy-D-manno-octulosonic acid transferase [Candidatus Edwardsbacteria bacterium]MBU2463231.1 3-deoxy-D-manno-octulosonic acid transferase [Candidatus Edwardsbacteria bacterium]MBU2593002.1 3-deoxy-D-manno-octulosonic acid transferase [Candidatus Edwardsbacteria bacterium]
MDLLIGLILYNIVLTMAFLLGWPYLLLACIFSGNKKWRQRCGLVPKMRGNPLWLHAASMGEAALIPPLIEALQKEASGYKTAISTMTQTGQDRAARINRGSVTFFLPLDFLFSIALSLGRIKPSALVLMETELWPNLMWLCYARSIPVFIVNARLSDRSLPWYRFFGFLFRPLLNRVECIACQSPEDAERYKSLGVDLRKIINAGNIKYDTIRRPVSREQKMKLRADLGFSPEDLILVAGSTREGEEEIILNAWAGLSDRMKLIIAPRHPERFSTVELILSNKNIPFSQRSKRGRSEGAKAVLLLDSMGELIDAYAAGDIALVGGSLVPVGGHNPLEPAALGLPVIFGPHMSNARESAQSLLASQGALQVSDAGELRGTLEKLSSDRESISHIGGQAMKMVEEKRGASEKAAKIIGRII